MVFDWFKRRRAADETPPEDPAASAVEALAPWLQSVQRNAFKPVTAPGAGEPRGSRFNGRPWLASGEAWPACGHCASPMPLFLQLDLERLPEPCADAFGPGLLQLFYCTACGDAWEPFSANGSLVRVLTAADGDLAPETAVDLKAAALRVTGWTTITDRPNWEEAESLGLQTETSPQGVRVTAAGSTVDTGWLDTTAEDALMANAFSPAPGDKLAGYPAWVQGLEYPNCPRCGARMGLLFQIDSEDHVPFMFGDVGTGHITQCPEHKDVVAFGWACC